MRVFYTPRYYADIGEGHVFPIRKFELVRDRLLDEKTVSLAQFVEPQPAAIADVFACSHRRLRDAPAGGRVT